MPRTMHSYQLTIFFSMIPPPPRPTLFPYTTLFRSAAKPPMAAAIPTTRFTTSNPCSNGRSVCVSESPATHARTRSEEHTSELQSHHDLVCRLLLEKKN